MIDFPVINGFGFIEGFGTISIWIWTEEIEEEYPFCIGIIEGDED